MEYAGRTTFLTAENFCLVFLVTRIGRFLFKSQTTHTSVNYYLHINAMSIICQRKIMTPVLCKMREKYWETLSAPLPGKPMVWVIFSTG